MRKAAEIRRQSSRCDRRSRTGCLCVRGEDERGGLLAEVFRGETEDGAEGGLIGGFGEDGEGVAGFEAGIAPGSEEGVAAANEDDEGGFGEVEVEDAEGGGGGAGGEFEFEHAAGGAGGGDEFEGILFAGGERGFEFEEAGDEGDGGALEED